MGHELYFIIEGTEREGERGEERRGRGMFTPKHIQRN